MNEQWTVLNCKDKDNLKNISNSRSSKYIGFVYIVEWIYKTGTKIKIGSTTSPLRRVNDFIKYNTYANIKLGRIAISQECTNYIGLEKALHKYYASKRIPRTELFNLDFDETINEIHTLYWIEFLDESKKKEDRDKRFLESIKNAKLRNQSKTIKNELNKTEFNSFINSKENLEELLQQAIIRRDKLNKLIELVTDTINSEN